MADAQEPGFGETYFSPLTDEQLAALGKITAIFGQIESQLEIMISVIAKIPDFGVLEIFLAGKQFAAKAELLKKLAKLQTLPETSSKVAEACEALASLAAHRNHAIHGCWGYLSDTVQSKDGILVASETPPVPAAYSAKRSNAPLKASDLDKLVKQAEGAARKVYEASTMVVPSLGDDALPFRIHFRAHQQFSRRDKHE